MVEGEDGTFEPLQLDNWEISPDQIIMDWGLWGVLVTWKLRAKIKSKDTMGWPELTSRAEKKKRKKWHPLPSTSAQTDY